LPPKVYVAAFGAGLGHAARMGAAAEVLENAGCEVIFSSWGDALRYLSARGFRCDETPSMDVGWDPQGGFAGTKDTLRRLPRMFGTFAHQVTREVDALREFHPDVVLSDSRLSTVVAAALLRLPTLVVTNQLKLLLPTEGADGIRRFSEKIGGEVLASVWSLSKEILLPDLPPPHTISEGNLWGIRSGAGKLRYVGFMVDLPRLGPDRLRSVRRHLGLDGETPVVFAQISGPPATKQRLIKMLVNHEIRGSRYRLVVSGGYPNGSPEPKNHDGKLFFEWCSVKDELFSLASAVLIRGGHGTIAQAILRGKPMVLLPIPHHTEQIGNAAKIAALGAGITLDGVGLSSSDLDDAIGRVVEEEGYCRAVSGLRDLALRYDGVKTVANTVLEQLGQEPRVSLTTIPVSS